MASRPSRARPLPGVNPGEGRSAGRCVKSVYGTMHPGSDPWLHAQIYTPLHRPPQLSPSLLLSTSFRLCTPRPPPPGPLSTSPSPSPAGSAPELPHRGLRPRLTRLSSEERRKSTTEGDVGEMQGRKWWKQIQIKTVVQAGVLLGAPDGTEACRGDGCRSDGRILTWDPWLRLTHLLFDTAQPLPLDSQTSSTV
ncbi:hypothetical protein DPEC_G00151300 [Dallia pectoralis]|uniref:Uncharacterized protein n=1 Tax=Dallia pectoralis TaxID=75939 RepID=A0ACC2GJ65_DALPE|nr:hypothetical protein DPEC_G00151300 [Dallia pectoralis]